jgi:mitochondrial enoyl-[acyl-carrier protein] reductase / trans-2-enoyl-CoA reductase
MKAVQIESFGDPVSIVHAVDMPEPEPPAEGEALLAVVASPINPSDLSMLSGTYGMLPKLPATPGSEGVGRVLAVGAHVTEVAVGDLVILPLGSGTWREKLTVRAAQLLPLPASADPLQFAMSSINPPSAYLMLKDYGELKEGDWVIQNAANSAVGQYLIRFAKNRGIKTVNVVRRAELGESLRAIGADVVVVDGPDLAARVAEATGKARIRLGIDAVAGAATGRLASCLAEGSTLVNYGAMSGESCHLAPQQLIFRDIHLRGFWLSTWFRKAGREGARELLAKMTELLSSEAFKVDIEATYPFSRIKEAIAHAQREGRSGKVLLVESSAAQG